MFAQCILDYVDPSANHVERQLMIFEIFGDYDQEEAELCGRRFAEKYGWIVVAISPYTPTKIVFR